MFERLTSYIGAQDTRDRLVASALALQPIAAGASPARTNRPTRLFERLTGTRAERVGAHADGERHQRQQRHRRAANLAMQDPDIFYNVTVRNFAQPMSNKPQSLFVPLNDYTATIIGMVRDNVPFNTVLSADLIYVGNGSLLPNGGRGAAGVLPTPTTTTTSIWTASMPICPKVLQPQTQSR